MRKILCNKVVIIVDKTNIVGLDLLAIVNIHFAKAKVLYENLSAILSGLLIIILLGNFF